MPLDYVINMSPPTSLSKLSSEAYRAYYEGNYKKSLELHCCAFNKEPKAWWHATEIIRILRMEIEPAESNNGIVIFTPNYAGNSYQKNLYSRSADHDFTVKPVDSLVLGRDLVEITFSPRAVVHQHWLKELYWKSGSYDEGVRNIDRHISILKALHGFGVTVCWTLHNLIDHDATDLQTRLCMYALREMRAVCDALFVHTKNSVNELTILLGEYGEDKNMLLPHPLYDDLAASSKLALPKEVASVSFGKRKVLLCAGMIRPYKGVPELVAAMGLYCDKGGSDIHLIIAGANYDPTLASALELASPCTKERITTIFRKLTDEELGGLVAAADAFVSPYRKILISGSYFLATSFRKPSIVPRRGMFIEHVQDGVNGFLYDGTVAGLQDALTRVAKMEPDGLREVGRQAFEMSKNSTIAETSDRFFKSLGEILCRQ